MHKTMTDWFPPHIKPVHIGVFLCEGGWSGEGLQFWNGNFWGGWADDPLTTKDNADFRSERQNPQWRGFTEKQA